MAFRAPPTRACHAGTVRAVDIAENVPVVSRATTGAQAMRVVAEYRLPGLVVVGDDGRPTAVIRGSELLLAVIPQYVRDDPRLARVVDEAAADDLCQRLNRTTVGELLDRRAVQGFEPPRVLPEDTILEVATAMAEGRYQLIVCTERDGRFVGTIMLSRVLAAIAARAGEDSELVQRRLTRDLIDGPSAGPDPALGP